MYPSALGPPPEMVEAVQLIVTLRPLIVVVGVFPSAITRALDAAPPALLLFQLAVATDGIANAMSATAVTTPRRIMPASHALGSAAGSSPPDRRPAHSGSSQSCTRSERSPGGPGSSEHPSG